MKIQNTTRGTDVADRAVPANNPWKRLVGLLNRSHLDPGEGLVLMPGGGIHMFGMRMAIDVIFVDRDGVVLKIAANVKPWRVVLAPRHSRYTIELPVGAIERSATVVGDVLELNIS